MWRKILVKEQVDQFMNTLIVNINCPIKKSIVLSGADKTCGEVGFI